MTDTKILNGQFFTTTNPFTLHPFIDWLNRIPEQYKNSIILEPFAGANNIPAMIKKSNILLNSWACFDIEPPLQNNCVEFTVTKQDTLKHFPKGYDLVITNPPYLGKTSASTKHLPFPKTVYDDLYKVCLDQMLANSKYIAAIIPETFIIANEFTERLDTVISLTCKMFDDTSCPVCLALFNKDTTTDFNIYRMNDLIGSKKTLAQYMPKPLLKHTWKINDPTGNIGIKCVDNNEGPTIRFCFGTEIDAAKIKVSSRSETRVSGLYSDINLDLFLTECNKLLAEYRIKTDDVFMAPFKNLRKDNKYRRRLDFYTAKLIMSKAAENIGSQQIKDDQIACLLKF